MEICYKVDLWYSYLFTSVRSARQVIDALNAEGPDIDIILSEVDLPMNKGMKMLKYITRDKELRRIPVIMMSAQDEVSIVVKCLRLGAADYLVKPLRTNELLNLWTHMWRRRRMLGLAEKNILIYDFDLVASDPSDANTNSTTLFSDDTDDKSRKCLNPEIGVSTHQEDVSAAAAATAFAAAAATAFAAAATAGCGSTTVVAAATADRGSGTAADEPPPCNRLEYRPDVPGISDRRTAQLSSGPKKSELKIGESSAFFTYVKSSTIKNDSQGFPTTEDYTVPSLRAEENLQACAQQVVNDAQLHENRETWQSYPQDDFRSSSSIPDSISLERSCTPPMSSEFPQRNFKDDKLPQVFTNPINELQLDTSGLSTQSMYPYYMSGVVNQVIMPPSAQLYQKNLHELQNNAPSPMLPQYNHLSQCSPHVASMASFPYYPVNLCLQPGQMPPTHPWPSFGGSSSPDVKIKKLDRREAALMKFRQKRKERCFDKKIRYVNRKKLAERRPRVRGQFVRKLNGVNVDLNGQPAADYDEDEEEDEDELALRGSSLEEDASGS
ncbi:two-component response regulator-like APRR1 isoform X3 [Ricinus communis]|uniref:two-component response regulator-like APRR1 isoform X3 n=1 Tax=Ricinus communis TaxID=3988 RepID=UPI0007721D9C|nr:two-component response regulator-like APRR1 isoform X3 [Ricinus communis]|eukprot:XP_015572034.1 two-component response regulator-like APRR1 isoform X3 [Ricinus communis]